LTPEVLVVDIIFAPEEVVRVADLLQKK